MMYHHYDYQPTAVAAGLHHLQQQSTHVSCYATHGKYDIERLFENKKG